MAQLISLFVLAAATTIVGAQTPPSAAPGKTDRITVIGCVKRSEPDTAAATGTTILSPGQTRYVLANVTLAGNDDQTATAEQVAAAVPMYRLADSADATIAPHVGEKVQVRGTIQSAPTSAEDSTANPQPPSPGAAVK
jgi:hypothetical protein